MAQDILYFPPGWAGQPVMLRQVPDPVANAIVATGSGSFPGGASVPAPYLGAVGCRGAIGGTTTNADRRSMSRTLDFLRDDVTEFRIIDSNFYTTQTGEVFADLAPYKLRRTVKFANGYYRVTWSGQDQTIVPPGTAYWLSDPITVPRFWGDPVIFDAFADPGTGKLPMSNMYYPGAGEQTSFLYGQTDETGREWVGSGTQQQVFRHTGILAMTRNASVAIVGTSRNDPAATAPPALFTGELAAIPAAMGTIHLSRSSQGLQQFLAGTLRRQLLRFVSAGICEGPTNDIAAGATSAEAMALCQQVRALAPQLPWYLTTIGPRVGGTFTDLAGQVPVASEPHRAAFNASVRAGAPGFEGYFETARAIEALTDPTRWRILPDGNGNLTVATTNDGIHANGAGIPLFLPAVDAKRIKR